MECGWIVTEVGRQPWIVYHLLRTSDAVTSAHGVPVTLAIVLALYLVLSLVTVVVPWRMGVRWRSSPPDEEDSGHQPYGPSTDESERPHVGAEA